MSEQYLILHKVRGEPSFDCAEKMEVDGEMWWITNSGYRAYPLRNWLLTDLSPELDLYSGRLSIGLQDIESWPDHFQVQGEKPPSTFNIMEAIQGLLPKVRRRV